MSEPDDKPDPEAGSASQSGKAKSLFDSDWDALLGSSASSSVSRPIFAPPKIAPLPIAPESAASRDPEQSEARDDAELRAADPVPRSSDARASVSGAFVAPQPRPEPAAPPRYEPPGGVTSEYDDTEDVTEDQLPILPPSGVSVGPEAADDDEASPVESSGELAKVIEFAGASSSTPAELATPNPGPPQARPRAHAPEPLADPEGEGHDGGSHRRSVAIGVIAAIVLLGLYIAKSGDRDERDDKRSELEQPTTPEPKSDVGTTLAADEGSTTEADTGETGDGATETGGPSEAVRPPPANVDPRDPSLIPPGTPEDNAKAFSKLPVSIHDGPPIGGIGRTGIHIDEISTSRGRENTDCDQPTETFSLSVAKYVNVCFRVVHPREPESLRVIWEKDGKVTRRGRVRIPDLHAYTTRAYLLLRPEYVGNWRVRIVPETEDSVDLAVAEFVITE